MSLVPLYRTVNFLTSHKKQQGHCFLIPGRKANYVSVTTFVMEDSDFELCQLADYTKYILPMKFNDALA